MSLPINSDLTSPVPSQDQTASPTPLSSQGIASGPSTIESLGPNVFDATTKTDEKINSLTFSFTAEQLPGWHERLTCVNGAVKSVKKGEMVIDGDQIIEHTLKPSELGEARSKVKEAFKMIQEKKAALQKELNQFQNPKPVQTNQRDPSTIQLELDNLTFKFNKRHLPNGWETKLTCRNGEVRSLMKDRSDNKKWMVVDGNQIIEHNLGDQELREAQEMVAKAAKVVQEKRVLLQIELVDLKGATEEQVPPTNNNKPTQPQKDVKGWGEWLLDGLYSVCARIKNTFLWLIGRG